MYIHAVWWCEVTECKRRINRINKTNDYIKHDYLSFCYRKLRQYRLCTFISYQCRV